MKCFVKVIQIMSIIIFSVGCVKSNISIVQNGTVDGYESLTVKQAFEGSFDEPQWSFRETKKGTKLVEFRGKVSQKFHDDAINALPPSWLEYPMKLVYGNINLFFEKLEMLSVENGCEFYSVLVEKRCNEEIENKICEQIADDFKMDFYKTGSSVFFQFTINVDKVFYINYFEVKCPFSFKNINEEDYNEFPQILKLIYKG